MRGLNAPRGAFSRTISMRSDNGGSITWVSYLMSSNILYWLIYLHFIDLYALKACV